MDFKIIGFTDKEKFVLLVDGSAKSKIQNWLINLESVTENKEDI